MDFTPRGGRPVPQEQPTQSHQQMPAASSQRPEKPAKSGGKMGKVIQFIMLVSIAILAIGVIGLLVLDKPEDSNSSAQASAVKTDQYQAIFLNGGQVYFGKVSAFNDEYVALQDIYYLRVNQQVQPGQQQSSSNDISLAKLGNELHGPEDIMYINTDEIQFWENLKDDGQVVKAIKAYQANPDAANQQTQQNTNNATQTNESNSNNSTNSDTNN